VNRFLETGLVVSITPFVAYVTWKVVKAINRQVQRIIPARLKPFLNQRLYQGLSEVEDQRRS